MFTRPIDDLRVCQSAKFGRLGWVVVGIAMVAVVLLVYFWNKWPEDAATRAIHLYKQTHRDATTEELGDFETLARVATPEKLDEFNTAAEAVLIQIEGCGGWEEYKVALATAPFEETALIRLGAVTAEERDYFIGRVQKIAAERGVSKKDVYRRSVDAIACRCYGYSTQEAIDAVQASYDIGPGEEPLSHGDAYDGAFDGVFVSCWKIPRGSHERVGRLSREETVRRIKEFDAADKALQAEIAAAGGFYKWKATQGLEGLEAARRAAVGLLNAETVEEVDQFNARAEQIAAKRKVLLRDVYFRAIDALTWRGGEWDYKTGGRPASIAEAMDAVDASYGLVPRERWPEAKSYAGYFRWDGLFSRMWKPRKPGTSPSAGN